MEQLPLPPDRRLAKMANVGARRIFLRIKVYRPASAGSVRKMFLPLSITAPVRARRHLRWNLNHGHFRSDRCPPRWIVLGVIAVIVIWAIMAYNKLVALAQRVNQAFADVDVQLKQRSDLIPNLVETVKGYAAHENGTLDAVISARNAAIAAPTPDAEGGGGKPADRRAAAVVRPVGILSRSQGQPELPAAADRKFRTSRTSSPPRAASSTTRSTNTTPAFEQFPAVLFAGMFGFGHRTFFDVERAAQQLEQAPSVKF